MTEKKLRGIYLLPSIITAVNISAGFISIIFSIQNSFAAAAWAIIVAMVMDILDGRIARMAKATSRFGIEFDSLADLVSFGVAPAILMYKMILHGLNNPGIAIALFYVLAGALRLARFNVKTMEEETPADYIGLPIPAAAAILASFALSYELFEISNEVPVNMIPIVSDRMPFFFKISPILMVFISVLMVSNVPYASFKKFKADRPKSLQIIIFTVIAIMMIIIYPQNTFFILFVGYLLSGLALYLLRYWRLRKSIIENFQKRRNGLMKNKMAGDKNEK
ncbi:MAG: CDP-diacylglycerol--serine O-phosphatidyltransferase [Elusimicrobia bacterium]|nr:CDP-diacylglycerol--serine O-phosphatidyltransferase [Elusimicrobiota bacterium]